MVNDKCIFIIGVSRTGSKFYMQLLNSNTSINISPELVFRHPFKKDLYKYLKKKSRKPGIDNAKYLKEFDVKDTYQKVVKVVTSEEKFIKKLNSFEVLEPLKIFELIIKYSAYLENKSVYGAKFPVHYSYLSYLLRHFKEAKILFLTRDPRAVFVYDYLKKQKEVEGNISGFPIKNKLLRSSVFFYNIIEWNMSLMFFHKAKKKYSNRIKLFRYEDILKNKKMLIESIVDFLKLPPNSLATSNIKVKDSSYKSGLSLDRWENEITNNEKKIIEFISKKRMKELGYLPK